MSDKKYERLDDNKIKMTIKVSPENMQKYKEKALYVLGEDLELEGFRKGKAPAAVVENHIDKVKLMMEMVDIAVKESYYEKVVELKDEFITIDTPKIEFKSKIDEKDLMEKGLEFTAEVATYPEFKLPDLKKIKLDRQEVKVTKDECNQALANFLQKRSSLEAVEDDHKIKNGDWVDIGFEITVGEDKLSDAGSKNFPLIVGNHSMIPGFEDELLGLKKGDTKQFDIDVDANYREPRMAGRKVTFDIVVNEIKSVEIPALTDEFVKTLQIPEVDSKDKFEKFLEENLLREKQQMNADKMRNDVLQKIDEKTDFKVPSALIDRELHMMWHEFEHNLTSKGIDPKDYMEKEKLDEAKIKEGWKEQAEKRVRYGLIINQVIREEKIDVEDKLVDERIETELKSVKSQLEASGQPEWEKTYQQYEQQYYTPEAKQQVKQRLLMDKMFEYLLDIVK